MGGGRAENGARAPLFLHLAPSQVPRQEGCPTRLFGGTDHARRIQAGKDRQWHATGAHRVRLRSASRRPPSRSVPKKRWRLGGTNEEHREPCLEESFLREPCLRESCRVEAMAV